MVLVIAVVLYVSANKQKIIRQVTMEISNQINGKVNIGNIELSFIRNFPHVSVLLQNVNITDSLFNFHHYTFFKGREIFVSIDVLRLIDHKPPIKGVWLKTCELYLYTDSTGYSNNYLLQLKKDSAGTGGQNEVKNELKNIVLKNIRFTNENQKKKKLYVLVINHIKAGVYNNP